MSRELDALTTWRQSLLSLGQTDENLIVDMGKFEDILTE
jgi:hypothetical protein